MDYHAKSEQVLLFSARGLKNSDTFSKSDPYAVLSLMELGEWKDLGATETLQDTRDPDWVDQVCVTYFFEEEQLLRVQIFDKDESGNDDVLGSAEFSLGHLIGAVGMGLKLPLSPQGELIVRAEEKIETGLHVKVQLQGSKLKNKDGFFGKSDPFLEVTRANEDGSYSVVGRTPVIENNLSPVWPQLVLGAQRVSNGDLMRPLRMQIKDWDSNGSHDDMGHFETSLEELSVPGGSWPVSYNGKTKGSVSILGEPSQFTIPTFCDYLRGGLELNVIVGIDFTASNGDPSRPGTLHHYDPNSDNQYQEAIRSCLTILSEYDYDKHYHVYGFGARVGGGPVQHLFPVGGEELKDGVDGVMEAYQGAFADIALSGPTLLKPLVEFSMNKAKEDRTSGKNAYTILLVVCDGTLTDMGQSINALVEASREPLSVVLVGVGNADFKDMDKLDGDGGMLKSSNGNSAVRDIVQFVPFRDYGGAMAGARLAKAVLAEIPDQVTAYMFAKGISPGHPDPPAFETGDNMAGFGVREPAAPPSYEDSVAFNLPGFGPPIPPDL